MATSLSPRQREILDRVAAGRTSKEIAVELGISESTVNWHLANAFARLGASTRAEAVARSLRPSTAVSSTPAPLGPQPWPRLVALAIVIALAGALVGGATVAAIRGVAPTPTQTPFASLSPNPTDRTPESTVPSAPLASAGPVVPVPPSLPTGAPIPSVPLITPGLPTIPPASPLPLPSLPIPTPSLPRLP